MGRGALLAQLLDGISVIVIGDKCEIQDRLEVSPQGDWKLQQKGLPMFAARRSRNSLSCIVAHHPRSKAIFILRKFLTALAVPARPARPAAPVVQFPAARGDPLVLAGPLGLACP